jgi:hypothetical protein
MKKILFILIVLLPTILFSQTYRTTITATGNYNSTTGTYRGTVTVNGNTTHTTVYSNGSYYSSSYGGRDGYGGYMTNEMFEKHEIIFKAWEERVKVIKKYDKTSLTKYINAGDIAFKFGYDSSLMFVTEIMSAEFGWYYYNFTKEQVPEIINIFKKADEYYRYCLKNKITTIEERKELGVVNGITFTFDIFYTRYSIMIDDKILISENNEYTKDGFAKPLIKDITRYYEGIKEMFAHEKAEEEKRNIDRMKLGEL